MKRLIAALACTAVVSSTWAMQVVITTAGGAFPQSPYTAQVAVGPIGENAQGTFFDTFCLERHVAFASNTLYDVTLSNSAITGGGGAFNNMDPVDLRTAWLYNEFLDGTDATVNSATANDVQNVIWAIEEEIAPASLSASAAALLAYVDVTATALPGLTQVFAMNLWDTSTGGDVQSMLVRSVIPVPGAVLLGLVGLAVIRRMR